MTPEYADLYSELYDEIIEYEAMDVKCPVTMRMLDEVNTFAGKDQYNYLQFIKRRLMLFRSQRQHDELTNEIISTAAIGLFILATKLKK